jgi:ArsR family transcriptional regulator
VPKSLAVPPHALFAALSDPTRLRLLVLLREGEVCVCDLFGALSIPQPTASRHLAILRRAGLVSVRKQGLWSYYALATPQSELHAKVLESLAHCAGESADGGKDKTRLARVRKARGCCE